jgi:hypothetical protein
MWPAQVRFSFHTVWIESRRVTVSVSRYDWLASTWLALIPLHSLSEQDSIRRRSILEYVLTNWFESSGVEWDFRTGGGGGFE